MEPTTLGFMSNQSFNNLTITDVEINYTISDLSDLEALGPALQAFLVTLYSLTALIAFAGNITVITVLICGKSFSKELRIYLINLALSDIAMAIFSIPFTYTDFMLGRWIFARIFCPVVMFMQHVSVIVSVYTLTAVGIDRFYAVMYPLSSRVTKSRGPYIMVGIWIVAIALSSVQLFQGEAVAIDFNGQQYYDCMEVWDETEGKIYTMVIFLVTFLLPMLILVFTYSAIGCRLFRHSAPGNKDETRDNNQIVAKMKIVKMLAVVVILFAFCWLPIQIFSLLIYFNPEFVTASSNSEYYTYVAAFLICHWLSMANSFVNPLIYCFMSDNFRMELKLFGHKWIFGRSKLYRRNYTFRSTIFQSTSCSPGNSVKQQNQSIKQLNNNKLEMSLLRA